MKKSILIFFAIIYIGNINLYSQMANHPTVDKVKVGYKAVPAMSGATNGKPDIKVLPEATISLKTTTGISKIYLKILNKKDNSVVYQANYNFNSSSITDPQGIKLFSRNNSTVFIGSPDPISLNQYVYEIITEDSQSNQSIVYSITQ